MTLDELHKNINVLLKSEITLILEDMRNSKLNLDSCVEYHILDFYLFIESDLENHLHLTAPQEYLYNLIVGDSKLYLTVNLDRPYTEDTEELEIVASILFNLNNEVFRTDFTFGLFINENSIFKTSSKIDNRNETLNDEYSNRREVERDLVNFITYDIPLLLIIE